MKRALSILRTQAVCQNALKNSFSSSSAITEKKDHISARSPKFSSKDAPDSSLYRRISPLGDPAISIVPVLDQWVREGRVVGKETLNDIIKSLKKFRRFKHALEISQWMTDKRYIPPATGDIMNRLHLIYKVHGLEKAEEYYNNISQVFKGNDVDIVLMNCYCLEKSVDKAEAMMQKLRETGSLTALPYNILMNLYCDVKSFEKIDTLIEEMETNGIYRDSYSFKPQLNAYAATSNIEGLNRTMAVMESAPYVGMDCFTYIIAANAFSKVGVVDKALEILEKVEKMATISKNKHRILDSLLNAFGKLKKKDAVYRVWKLLQKDEIYNTGYRSMIVSLLNCDDLEGAEEIFEEWETRGLTYDFRIPHKLIKAYVEKGKLEKAEVLLNRGIEKGGTPSFTTWYCLAHGYIEDNQVVKGVEALKNAASSFQHLPYQEPIKGKLVICLEYIEKRRNTEGVEEFINSLEVDGIFSSTVCEKLLDIIKNGNSKS